MKAMWYGSYAGRWIYYRRYPVPYLPESLQRNAYRAMQLLDRFPVNEVVE